MTAVRWGMGGERQKATKVALVASTYPHPRPSSNAWRSGIPLSGAEASTGVRQVPKPGVQSPH